jgi:hypothetical protein
MFKNLLKYRHESKKQVCSQPLKTTQQIDFESNVAQRRHQRLSN